MITFSAVNINAPADQAFVKWEAFEDGQMKIFQVAN